MGVNYGVRGGDIIDLNQVNSYIFNLEQSANVNFFVNTHHFNLNTSQDNIAFVGFFSKERLCIASVYVMLQSDTDPTVYPGPPTIKNIATNASVTATKIDDNKQVFEFKKNAIDYKMVVLRTVYSLSAAGFYMRCAFSAINTVKDITSTNYKLNQFLCWQEMETKIDYARLSEDSVGVYTDFVFANQQSKSAFAGTLIDGSNNALFSVKFPNAFITEFFNLGNFTKEYLRSMRFIFKKNTGNTISTLIYSSYFSLINFETIIIGTDIQLETVNDYTDFSIMKLFNIENFILAIEKAYNNSPQNFKTTITRRSAISLTANFDYCLGIVCENTFFQYPTMSSTDSLNAATLYCTKRNANSTHNAANFHSEIGLDINQNLQSSDVLYTEGSFLYPFWLIFKNNYFQSSNEFSFDYVLKNGYTMKAGFTSGLIT